MEILCKLDGDIDQIRLFCLLANSSRKTGQNNVEIEFYRGFTWIRIYGKIPFFQYQPPLL